MISDIVLEKIIMQLTQMAENLPQSGEDFEKDNKLDIIKEFCLRIQKAYFSPPKPLRHEELKELENNTRIAKEKRDSFPPNSEEFNKANSTYTKLKHELDLNYSASAIDQLFLINDSAPDELSLLTLINIFNNFSHGYENSIITKSYIIKDMLLTELLKSYPKDSFLVMPSKNNNAKSVIYIKIKPGNTHQKFLAFHSKIQPPFSYKKNALYQYLLQRVQRKDSNIQEINEDDINDTLRKLNIPQNAEPHALINNKILDYLWSAFSKGISFNVDNPENLTIADMVEEVEPKEPQILNDTTTEFSGGGSYELSEESPPQKTGKEILEEIRNSNNERVQEVLDLTDTEKRCLGYNLSDVIKIETLNIAKEEGIITDEELEILQLEAIDSLISSNESSERIKIKSTHTKNVERYFFALHLQPSQTSKPVIWEITSESLELLMESHPQLKIIPGTIVKNDNLNILKKLANIKKATIKEQLTEEFSEEIIYEASEEKDELKPETKTSVFEITAESLDSFLSLPDSQEKLKEIVANMDPRQKAIIAFILSQAASPEDKERFNPNRNGGIDR